MACSACQKRREKLLALKAKKRQQGKQVQAQAIQATVDLTDMVAKVLGIKGKTNES